MDSQKTIFLLDDADDDLFLMGEAILDLELDINVYYAYNGLELPSLLRNHIERASIIIEMNMPIMNGIETLREIYSRPDQKHLPSILISTHNSVELKQAALDAGAIQFI